MIYWRRGGKFAAGLLAQLVGASLLVACSGGGDGRAGASSAPPATVPVVTSEVDCSFAPIVRAANREDGMLPLDKDLQGRTAASVKTLILSGKEAAAAGKPRDAEAAFLMACRSAENIEDNPEPLAEAHYQLGRHYAVVARAPDVPRREEMLKRSQRLYASALNAFTVEKGAEHERTKFARQGLENLQQMAGGILTPLPMAPVAQVQTAQGDERAARETRIAGAAPQPAPDADAQARAQAEMQAKAQAEAQAKAQAEAQARAQAEAQARAQAEAQARARAEAQARAQADAQAKAQAEAQARAQADAQAKAQAQAQAQAQARMQAEARAREQAQAQAREQAEARAREQAKAQAEAQARQQAEARAAREQAAERSRAQAREQQEERVAAAAPAAPQPRRTSPSFDCDKARSTSEKLICADEDLARQDRELGRIYDRAKRAAPDPRAFQRDSDAEWQRREDTCRDRECLQRWYAQRRAQLSAQAEAPRRREAAPAPRVVEPAGEPEPPRVVVREPQSAPAQEIVIDGPATASGSIE